MQFAYSQSTRELVYEPFDEKAQLARLIEGYPRSFSRNPSQQAILPPQTLLESTGPSGLGARLDLGTTDFSRQDVGAPRAIGQLIVVSGRVLDQDGSPVAGALIELWQANAAGKYVHEMDRFDAPIDPNFTGVGRIVTDGEGAYSFQSIKPGAYPVAESDWWWRPPHIHFSIVGPTWSDRFVTQIFFPGDPLNDSDLLLNSNPDPEVRQRLIFEAMPSAVGKANALGFQRDFVLRGKRRTPGVS